MNGVNLPFLVARGLLGGVTKVKDVCEEDSDAPGMELLLAGENDCLVPTPMGTGDPCLGTGDPCLGEPPRGEPEKYSFLFWNCFLKNSLREITTYLQIFLIECYYVQF